MTASAEASDSGIRLQNLPNREGDAYIGTTANGDSQIIQGTNHRIHQTPQNDHSNNNNSLDTHAHVHFHAAPGTQHFHAAPGTQHSPAASPVHSIAENRSRARGRNLCARCPSLLDTKTKKVIAIGLGVSALAIGLGVGLGVGLPSNNGSTAPTSSLDLREIKPNSPLAVTGWYDQSANNYRIRLYYQGPDQSLRYSAWASNGSWYEPVVIGTAHLASNNTPLAAGVTLETNATYKLIYVDSQFNMRAQGYDDWLNANQQGTAILFNDGYGALPISPSSQTASYWPFIVSQNSDGMMQWWYRGEGPAIWTKVSLGIRGSSHAQMAVVPASAEYLDEGRLFYRSNDGNLRDVLVYNVTIQSDDSQSPLGISIDENAAIAAFAIARDETTNLTNTYVLYQDSNSTIQVMWQDDDTGWKGPRTYDAFDGADNGTEIACLTLSTWARTGVSVRISASYEMCRCYFQVNVDVRQVTFNGTDWEISDSSDSPTVN